MLRGGNLGRRKRKGKTSCKENNTKNIALQELGFTPQSHSIDVRSLTNIKESDNQHSPLHFVRKTNFTSKYK